MITTRITFLIEWVSICVVCIYECHVRCDRIHNKNFNKCNSKSGMNFQQNIYSFIFSHIIIIHKRHLNLEFSSSSFRKKSWFAPYTPLPHTIITQTDPTYEISNGKSFNPHRSHLVYKWFEVCSKFYVDAQPYFLKIHII